jgi:hypothetical protein
MLASHVKRFQDVLVNFPWKLTKDKVVNLQSLELVGWYQTVPYLQPKSQVRWHIEAICQQTKNHSGASECKTEHSRTDDVSMTKNRSLFKWNCTCTKPWPILHNK